MAYVAPYIDNTGMHVPSYSDIRDDLIASMKSIFGQDIYIDEDSMDYQMISIFARKIYDTNNLALLVYNNRTANTSVGVGLDNLCSLVGIERKPATYSLVQLTITGDPGTEIQNGKVSDGTYTWNLPEEVTIPSNGTIFVEAKCNDAGNISAAANTITTIVTPVYGWLSCTNNYPAVPGTDIETDAELRGRYYISTLQPSSTILEGILASVESVEGVTRAAIYENDTNTTSPEGFPAHSITVVAEGGSDNDVAHSILNKKTPGCLTNGTTTVNLITDTGLTIPIRFYRPSVVQLDIQVYITKLAGYNDSYEDDIKSSLVKYINELSISDDVYPSLLLSVCINQMATIESPAYTVTDIKLSTDGGSTYTPFSDPVLLAFNEVAYTELADIEVIDNNA